jgi:hypothetical protein
LVHVSPCFGQYNWQLKNQTNAIGAIHQQKLFAVGLFDCKINADVFHFWLALLHKGLKDRATLEDSNLRYNLGMRAT